MLRAGFRAGAVLLLGAVSVLGGRVLIYSYSPGVDWGPRISVPADYSFSGLFTFDSSAPILQMDQLVRALSGASPTLFLLSGNSANRSALQLLTLGTSFGYGGSLLLPLSLETSSIPRAVVNSTTQVVPEPSSRVLFLSGLLFWIGIRKAALKAVPWFMNTS